MVSTGERPPSTTAAMHGMGGCAPSVLDDPTRMLVGAIRVRALVARACRLQRRDEAPPLGLEVLAACAALRVLLAEALLIEAQHLGPSRKRGHTAALEAAHEEVLGQQVAVRHVVGIEEESAWHRVIRARDGLLTKEGCDARHGGGTVVRVMAVSRGRAMARQAREELGMPCAPRGAVRKRPWFIASTLRAVERLCSTSRFSSSLGVDMSSSSD